MKILLIHTKYLQEGGEDTVFDQEYDLLSSKHSVRKVVFYNKSGIWGAIQFFGSIFNLFSMYKVWKAASDFRPDVAHVHNFHFALGPGVISCLNWMDIPIIVTLHNFRLICPSATLSINGDLFLDSLDSRFPWTAIKRRAYRKSYIQTFWLAFVIWFHKKLGTWCKVNQYVSLTAHARKLFIKSTIALPPHKISTKPNFIQEAQFSDLKRDKHFLFVGRLTYEKGIDVLLEAFNGIHEQIHIIGSGPLDKLVLDFAARNPNVKYLGNQDRNIVLQQMNKCSALIFPSIWFEGMPMTIIEAFATGTPVIGSRLGAMETMISDGSNGLLFEPKGALDLRNKVFDFACLSDEEKVSMQKAARQAYEELYSPQANLDQLMSIYKRAASIVIN